MILSRDAILKAPDRKHMDVDVPEWGGAVRLLEMTGRERSAMYQALVKADGSIDSSRYAVVVVAMTLAGEDGSRLFSIGDADALFDKASAPLERLFSSAQEINGLGAKATESAEKNSAATPNGAGS